MWIMSKYGFFSVVQHKSKPDTFLVRARAVQDLRNLQDAAGLTQEIDTHSGTDYPCRVYVSTADLLRILIRLGESVDHGNFKSMIDKSPTQEDKSNAYHKIWGVMHDWQQKHG